MIELGRLGLGTAPIGGLYESRRGRDRACRRRARVGARPALLRHRAPLRRGACRAPARSGAARQAAPGVRDLDEGRTAAPARPVRVVRGACARRLLRLLARGGTPLARGEPRAARARPRRCRVRARPGRPLRRGAGRCVPRLAAAPRRGRRRRDRRRRESHRGALPVRARGRSRLLPRRRPIQRRSTAARPTSSCRSASNAASP